MKTILFRITLLTLCLSLQGYAQKTHERTYTEEFNTNGDVEIKVDTRYTNIIIEPWSKNTVRVEATIKVEGVSDERAEKTLDNWNFKALGNKTQIEITTREDNLLVSGQYFNPKTSYIISQNNALKMSYPKVNSFSFSSSDTEPRTLITSDINQQDHKGNVVVIGRPGTFVQLDSIAAFSYHYDFPNADAVKALTAMIPEFDYEMFQKDQNYMLKWQKEMKESMKEFSEAQKELQKHSEKLSADQAKKMEELQKSLEEVNSSKVEIAKRIAERKQELAQRNAQLEKYKEEKVLANKQRLKSVEIKTLLENREKINVTRSIVIKAPKNAKFTLDAKYGTVSFSK